MKKTLVSIAVIGLFAGAAQASDGVITFKGQLTAATCAASVNNGGGDATVTLPATPVNILDGAGKTAGTTNFTISLNGCSSNTGARTFFENGSMVNSSTGRLLNALTSGLGGADNVELELLGDLGDPIFVGSDTQYSAPYAPIVNGAATLNYAVRYYATGVTTPGGVGSMVSYTMDYQ